MAEDDASKGSRARGPHAHEAGLDQRSKLEALGLLAGGIAHDFNNLLVGVVGNAEAALAHLTPEHPSYSLVRAVMTAGERASELTRELLDYAGRGSTHFEALEALTLLWETAELVRPVLPSNVVVRMESSDMHVWVRGDASQLRRLFMNLIKNAAEAFDGEPGQVLISAHANERADGDWVCIRVRDEGKGMDELTRTRAFEPFFSTKQAGHGLGLAAAQSIVNRHGGSISIVSAIGSGTTFLVNLPRQSAPAQEPTPTPAIDFRAEGVVLLVDDDPNVRLTTAMLLELHGFEVTPAANGEAALALFEAAPDRFRFVMLDSSMPGLDGAQTLKAIRALRPTLPVLMCSGHAKDDVISAVDRDPATSFLSKPFRRVDLVAALRALLGA